MAILAQSLAMPVAIAATSYAWNGMQAPPADFNSPANWMPGTGSPGSATGDNAIFGPSAGLTTSIHLGASPANTITYLQFTGSGYSLTASASAGFTLSSTGISANAATPAAVAATNTTGSNSINVPITLTATTGYIAQTGGPGQGAGGTLNIAGAISGNNVSFHGNTNVSGGNIILTGDNTYTGATNVRSTLVIQSIRNVGSALASSLGKPANVTTGTITIGTNSAAGYLVYNGSADSTTDRVVHLNAGNVALGATGSGKVHYTSNLTLGSIGNINLALNGASTANNEISGAIGALTTTSADRVVNVTKSDAGRWILSGNNTYTGNTTVNGGTLLVNNTSGSGTGTGAVSVAAARFGGGGRIAPAGTNGIAFQNTSTIVVGGDGIESLEIDLGNTTGAVNASSASFEFQLGAAGTFAVPGVSDRLLLSNIAAGEFDFASGVSGKNTIDFLNTGADGVYKLFDSTLANSTAAGDAYDFITYDETTGLIASGDGFLAANVKNGGQAAFYIGTAANGGNLGDIYVQLTNVPEPASFVAIGLLGLGMLSRRRRAMNMSE